MSVLTQKLTAVLGLVPVADRYNANPATDVVNMKLWGHALFLLSEGAGGVGTVKLQMEGCTAKDGTGATALPFKYRVYTKGVWGALTAIVAAGYTTVAGANKMVAVEMDAADIGDTYQYVRMQLTEVANDPCAAGVDIILSNPKFRGAVLDNPLS